jgi:sulfoxide reductase heme-binding subunit YedZ
VLRNVKIGIFTLCLSPLAWVIYAAGVGRLGPDPIEALMLFSGEWALRMLALTLLVSPLHKWTGWSLLMKVRRMLGLFAFFYGCVHFFVFLQFYLGWDIARLSEELAERPFITLGFSAWLLMLPLAATSTRGMQRRLRGNWQRLHRLVYPAAVLACLHLLWQARSDVGEALVYLAIFAGLLAWRAWRFFLKQRVTAVART